LVLASVGPTAIVVFVLLVIFIFLYWLADRVDKEDELKKQWQEYYARLKEQEQYYYQEAHDGNWV
jgi:preprotein translocase subunit SecG